MTYLETVTDGAEIPWPDELPEDFYEHHGTGHRAGQRRSSRRGRRGATQTQKLPRSTVITLETSRTCRPSNHSSTDCSTATPSRSCPGPQAATKASSLWASRARSASGQSNWVGHRIPRREKVVYVAAEGATGLRARILAWCERNPVDPAELERMAARPAPPCAARQES